MISSEMEELMECQTELLCVNEGRQTGEVSRESFSQEIIMEKASNIVK